jgi:uncharacterized protein (DUF924 family)
MSDPTGFNGAAMPAASATLDAHEVVDFWRIAGSEKWFAKDPAFDAAFRNRFLDLHEMAARGDLELWSASSEGALALAILLDQFPRNAFRGTPRMYATDTQAHRVARMAIAAGHDRSVSKDLRLFLYLPFAHSENLADQDRSVELNRLLGPSCELNARRHRDVVTRFGRFPHRNCILGRKMTNAEQDFLDAGGFGG